MYSLLRNPRDEGRKHNQTYTWIQKKKKTKKTKMSLKKKIVEQKMTVRYTARSCLTKFIDFHQCEIID